MSRGIQQIYYTRELPASKAIAIAHISIPPLIPAQLTDINNTPYLPGLLTIQNNSSPSTIVTAPDYNQAVKITGDVLYIINNQFFELSNYNSAVYGPLFYCHPLPSGVSNAVVTDLSGNIVTKGYEITDNIIYHDFPDAHRIRYVGANGYFTTTLLLSNPVVSKTLYYPPSYSNYALTAMRLTVYSGEVNYYIRFTQPDAYMALPPYNEAPNTPWYPRIRYSLNTPAQEWSRQVFLPSKPYVLGTWVPGVVLDKTLVEFERKQMMIDQTQLPDIIVFNSDYSVKYALEGTPTTSADRKGTIYNWKRGQIKSIDFYKARVDLLVQLDPTDLVFGFYSYREQDIIYTGIDVNPYTNPSSKNTVVRFYYRTDEIGQSLATFPGQVLFHQGINASGENIIGETNDPYPVTNWANTNIHAFADMIVGSSISISEYTVTDARVRGGGLGSNYRTIPQADHFWDLGYWDGRPWPIGGAMIVYLPVSVLDSESKEDINAMVSNICPTGSIASVRYYDSEGNEII